MNDFLGELETFIRPAQQELFTMLHRKYKDSAVVRKGKYLLVEGETPILLVAHLDTVHEEPVVEIVKSDDGNIWRSPQGIGGDDRCGVYALVQIRERAPQKPWLLFTCDEEIGRIGASAFAQDHAAGRLPKKLDGLRSIIELDRRGARDAVYYECDNAAFERYITSKGFVTEFGSCSDISVIAPALGAAAVNLSCGYHGEHALDEHINIRELDHTIDIVLGIVADAARGSAPRYGYVSMFDLDHLTGGVLYECI